MALSAWEQVGAFFGFILAALWFAWCGEDHLPEPPRRKLAERREYAYTIDPGMELSRGGSIERFLPEPQMCVACGFEMKKGHDCNAY